MEDFAGQVAIISGGLGDIGSAVAREFAAQGADVALGDIRPSEDAAGLMLDLRNLGRKARYDVVDVSNGPAVAEWVFRAESDLGPCTLIVPNAAIVTLESIRTVTAEQWSRELRINLDGAFHLAQAGALRLLAHGLPGRIVFVGSWAAHAAHPQIPAYCTAKAGIRMLCRCMALELAPYGILVNEVAPGYVDAGLSGRIFDENPGRRELARQQVPIGRLITAEEVARQVAYLCAPANVQMTGSILLMDGGLSLINPGSMRDEG